MKMPIPKNIKVGRHWYVVHEPVQMHKTATKGETDYYLAAISVAKQCNVTKRKYKSKERAEVFWHELTHAILFDMGDRRAYDEKFVTAFSKRLNDAIHSAEF